MDHFKLILLLRRLENDQELSADEKLMLIDELLTLPNQVSWSKLIQASIFESDCDKMMDLLHESGLAPKVIQDISLLFPNHGVPIQLIMKICMCINSIDKIIGQTIFRFCSEDRECEPSVYRYVSNTQTVSKDNDQTICRSLPFHKRLLPESQKLQNEVQKIIDKSDVRKSLDLSVTITNFRVNPLLSQAERFAKCNIEMVDDGIRSIHLMSQSLGQKHQLGKTPLV
jgi:hypothetical protein